MKKAWMLIAALVVCLPLLEGSLGAGQAAAQGKVILTPKPGPVLGQVFMNPDAADVGIREDADFVPGFDLRIEKGEGRVFGVVESVNRRILNVEEKDEFPIHDRSGRSSGAGLRFNVRRLGLGRAMNLEIRDFLDLAVILKDKIFLGQVLDWIPVFIGDIDLNELQGDSDIVFER